MTGDIDTTLPVCKTHLLDHGDEVIHVHGGIATEVTFDKLEEMSVDEFVKRIVPTLGQDKDRFVILRDSVSGNLVRILNDTALVYHIKDLSDVFIDTLMDKLITDRPITIRPNLQYPLVQYSSKDNGQKDICVYIPEKQFVFHASNSRSKPFVMWHPPLWLNVQMTSANIPGDVRIGVVLERTPNIQDTVVYHLPFPNMYSWGGVCFGNAKLARVDGRAPTEGDAIHSIYNTIFSSTFNLDLTGDEEQPVNRYYEKLPKLKEYEALGGSFFVKLARCFKERADIFNYPYHKLQERGRSVPDGSPEIILRPINAR